MGKDNQAKVRQAKQLTRKIGRRAPIDRILIVTEGSKTEPFYLNEIRSKFCLQTANVQVQPSKGGTEPFQIVEYAEKLFQKGNVAMNIQPRAFEQVYVVFDRDSHNTYHNALAKAASLDGKLHNDLNQSIKFEAIASVPCFELWLLLHFENVQAPLQRTDVYQHLRLPGNLPNYDKGKNGYYARTEGKLGVAKQRAENLKGLYTACSGTDPYTDMHNLVHLLTNLKK